MNTWATKLLKTKKTKSEPQKYFVWFWPVPFAANSKDQSQMIDF